MKNLFLAAGLIFGFAVLTGSAAAESAPFNRDPAEKSVLSKDAETAKKIEATVRESDIIDLLEKAAPAEWADYLISTADWIEAVAEESKVRVKLRSAAPAEFDEWRQMVSRWNQERAASLRARDDLRKTAPEQFERYFHLSIKGSDEEALAAAEAELIEMAREEWAAYIALRDGAYLLQDEVIRALEVLRGPVPRAVGASDVEYLAEGSGGVAELEWFEYLNALFERKFTEGKLKNAAKAIQEAAPAEWAKYKEMRSAGPSFGRGFF